MASNGPDFDKVLKNVAKGVPNDDAIEELGEALGFKVPEIDRYKDTNLRGTEKTSRGTLSMLRKWRDGQPKAEERGNLRNALVEAGLSNLADTHLPKEQAGKPRGVYITKVQVYRTPYYCVQGDGYNGCRNGPNFQNPAYVNVFCHRSGILWSIYIDQKFWVEQI